MYEPELARDVWTGLAVVLSALLVCVWLIVMLRPLMVRYALARPNERSSHKSPTPQGGGIAVVVATIIVTLIFVSVIPQLPGSTLATLAPVLTAAALLALVGAVDDIFTLPVSARLVFQAAAVAAVVVSLPVEARVVAPLPFWIERSLLMLAGVWFVNLVNFMDGIDWITVAEVVPVAAGLAIAGALGALPLHGVIVALALLGGVLGFAFFNRPIARLFLGDVGSLPIGLLLGWLLILLATAGYLAAAFLLPLYYLADASITLLRRLFLGERIWQAHRSHFYQRAFDQGLSVLEIDARIFLVNAILVCLAATTVICASLLVDLGAIGVGAMLVGLLLLRFARGKPKGSGT